MTTASTAPARSPITWVASLYFVQGMQFFVVMLIAGLMFKNMGVANDQIARWTGLLGLAWAFKPLWSPFLEMARSKKLIVVAMQFTGAAGLALMATDISYNTDKVELIGLDATGLAYQPMGLG